MSTQTLYCARYRSDGSILLAQRIPDRHIPEESHAEIQAAWKVSSFETKDQVKPASSRSAPLRIAGEAMRFAGTFTTVFLILFIGLNFSSFRAVIGASLLPGMLHERERHLSALTEPREREHAMRGAFIPIAGGASLPTAGPSLREIASMLTVAPPDNRIIIPAIGKNVPIVEVSDAALRRKDFKAFDKDILHALRFGVVHYPGTAKPGQIGNSFLTGHSSYYMTDSGKYKDVFALLSKLEIGDEYSIYYDEQLYRYRVTEKFEVSPKDVSVLDQPLDRRISTIMTCTPLGTTLRRLIVRAEEILDPSPDSMQIATQIKSTPESEPPVFSVHPLPAPDFLPL